MNSKFNNACLVAFFTNPISLYGRKYCLNDFSSPGMSHEKSG